MTYLVVKVSGNFLKLLNVCGANSDDANTITNIIIDQLNEFILLDKIKFIDNDTTNVNSGCKSDVAVRLEKFYLNELNYEYCPFIKITRRHHEIELYLTKTFDLLFG